MLPDTVGAMRWRWTLAALLAACGDNLDTPDAATTAAALEIVGHADLGARGMNAALAVADTTVYVGSRIDSRPVLIVDVADPAAPRVVGELGPPDEGVAGISSRELRAVADLDLLIVLNLQCSPDLHGCAAAAAEIENLKIYDIADRRAPRLLSPYRITGTILRPRSPHEMYLWRDPANPARVLLLVSTPPGPDGYEIVDLTDPMMPVRVAAWDAVVAGGLVRNGSDGILHSVSASRDGRTAWFSHQTSGLVAVDQSQVIDGVPLPELRMVTPPAAALTWEPASSMGPHSAVPVPGRSLLLVTEEIYPPPFGTGCPWGHVRMVDASDRRAPAVVGEYRVPENDPAYCSSGAPTERITFTAHNATVTGNLGFVTWYSAGLHVIDLSDPAAPRGLLDFRPEPLAAVATEDPALGGNPVGMWSYPVIANGLVYVVDTRNGLYVLRYRGPYEVSALPTSSPVGARTARTVETLLSTISNSLRRPSAPRSMRNGWPARMLLKSSAPESARMTSSASGPVSPLRLSRRPSVSPLATLPSTLPGGPTGAGVAGSADAGAGAISGWDGSAAAGVFASASRLIAATEVSLSQTNT